MRSVKWFHFKWSWVTPNLHVKVTILSERNKCIEDDVKAAACQSPNCIKKTTNTIRQKRFSIWWMEFFHPAMWHVALGWHVIEFARWQRPSVWHVALGSWHWVYQVAALCNVTCGCEMNGVATRWWKNCIAIVFARWQQPAMWHVALGSWHWIRQVAPSCNVGRGSGIISHWVRPNVRHMSVPEPPATLKFIDYNVAMTFILIIIIIIIWEFYFWFRFWPYHCSLQLHVILHQSMKFYPNCTALGRENWCHVDFQDGRSPPSWSLGFQ